MLRLSIPDERQFWKKSLGTTYSLAEKQATKRVEMGQNSTGVEKLWDRPRGW
jgi:hypothetical protein